MALESQHLDAPCGGRWPHQEMILMAACGIRAYRILRPADADADSLVGFFRECLAVSGPRPAGEEPAMAPFMAALARRDWLMAYCEEAESAWATADEGDPDARSPAWGAAGAARWACAFVELCAHLLGLFTTEEAVADFDHGAVGGLLDGELAFLEGGGEPPPIARAENRAWVGAATLVANLFVRLREPQGGGIRPALADWIGNIRALVDAVAASADALTPMDLAPILIAADQAEGLGMPELAGWVRHSIDNLGGSHGRGDGEPGRGD